MPYNPSTRGELDMVSTAKPSKQWFKIGTLVLRRKRKFSKNRRLRIRTNAHSVNGHASFFGRTALIDQLLKPLGTGWAFPTELGRAAAAIERGQSRVVQRAP
jgi:hypothetical protein